MKRAIGLSLLSVVALGNGQAIACTPPFPSEAMAREYRNVILGKVDSSGFTQQRGDAAAELLIRVERLEILSGNTPGTVTAVVPCSVPLRLGERVIVATHNGRRFVYPADMYEKSFRSIHDRKR